MSAIATLKEGAECPTQQLESVEAFSYIEADEVHSKINEKAREATPSTMYSVDAPVYNMMGQRVDKSQKGLVIYKGRKYVNK